MSIHNDVYLPAPCPFFSCCYGNDRSHYSLVHWSAVKKALDVGRFFQKSWTFFNTLRAAEKDAGGGVLKSAQDFFENTVYSIGL